jgi:hypothetical protein
MGEIMHKHRITFIGVWLAFTIALFIVPGFEMRGLAMGMIIGYWPAAISEQLCESQHHYPFIFLLMMVILSGTTVGLLAWFLDKARMTKKIWLLLGFLIIVGSSLFPAHRLSFEDWKRIPAVSQSMESPEVNYQPSRWDFSKEIVIPRALVGGLWGLYGTTGICALCAVAVLVKIKPTSNKAMHTDVNSAQLHPRR